MGKKAGFWVNSTPGFKKTHFVIAIISLACIIISASYIYNHFFPRTFLPDINEQTQIPPDVKRIEDLTKSNSPQAATAAALLRSNLLIPFQFQGPLSFKIPI